MAEFDTSSCTHVNMCTWVINIVGTVVSSWNLFSWRDELKCKFSPVSIWICVNVWCVPSNWRFLMGPPTKMLDYFPLGCERPAALDCQLLFVCWGSFGARLRLLGLSNLSFSGLFLPTFFYCFVRFPQLFLADIFGSTISKIWHFLVTVDKNFQLYALPKKL